MQKLTSDGKSKGIVYTLGSAVTFDSTQEINPGGDSTLSAGRYSGYTGDLFTIDGSSTNVTFSNLTFETGNGNEDKNLISITHGNTLTIGENVKVEQGGVFAMQASGGDTSKPIELLAMPEDGTTYTLSCGDIAEGKVLVHTHGLEALSYFKLTDTLSANYGLIYNSDGDIMVREKVTYGDCIYLDGASGNDDNSGSSAVKAVKTYEKALELCKKQNIKKIAICGTVEIGNTTSWETATVDGIKVTIERAEDFTNSLIKVTGGVFTFTANSPVINAGNGTGIEVYGGTFNMSGGTISSSFCGINIESNGTLNLSGAATIGSSGTCSIRNAGTFNLSNNMSAIKGYIELSGKPMTLKMSYFSTSYWYSLKLSGFRDGDTVVDGGKVTSADLANKFTLVSADGYIYRDTTANNMRYMSEQKEVYLDPTSGYDSNTGRDETVPVKTLTKALEITSASATINTIYVMNTVDITTDTAVGDTTNGLTVKPYGKTITKMFNVTERTLTLGKVTIEGSNDVNSIYINGGTLVSGEDTVLSGGKPDVLVKDGLFDMAGGSVGTIELDDNDSNANGQLKLYDVSKITSPIQVTADAYYTAPVTLGGGLD